MKNKKLWMGVIVIALVLSTKYFNDYRERNLSDLIDYKRSDFYAIAFMKDRDNVPENSNFEWWTEDKEAADDLMEFLGQYRVKKVTEAAYVEHLNKDSFEFMISHFDSKTAMVQAVDGYIHILVGDYYEVVNGPIDMDWIEEFNKKNLENLQENPKN